MMTPAVNFVALLFIAVLHGSEGARILGIFPIPGRSHMAVNAALVQELARRGHQVTVASPFPLEKPIPNYRDIKLKEMKLEDLINVTGMADKPNPFFMTDMNYIQRVAMLWGMGSLLCNAILPQDEVQELINTKEEFDLIILENFFVDCFLGFAHKFKVPVVQVSAFGGTAIMGDLVGNPSPYSYVPDPFQDFSDKMNMVERFLNSLGQLFQKVGHRWHFIPQQDEAMRKHFKDPNMPSVLELQKSTALLLVNHHYSISYPRPLVPNFVQVGGMHVKPPKKLPADLQKFLDEAPDGVIYFSMGSNIKSSDMPESTTKAFVDAFSSLKQKVLWKWEKEVLPGQPANLKLGKWLPQSDILAHPNVRVFITHGGLLSTQETIHRGVPVVGIPIFGDQRLNMARTESLGVGIKLEFKNLSKESITWTLKEVMENPKYRENAQRLSKIYRDQPLTPLEQAVFWTEYVIRHKGAPHMRSAALDLCWYQYFLLDVIAVLALAAGSVLLVSFLITRALYRRFCGGSRRKSEVSGKKKRN